MIQIASALAGKRIAITGTTGFLGTALLERLLRQVPDADIVLLLRAGRRSTVQQRATREIFRPSFSHTRGITNSANCSLISWKVLSPVTPWDHERSSGSMLPRGANFRRSRCNCSPRSS